MSGRAQTGAMVTIMVKTLFLIIKQAHHKNFTGMR